MENLADSILEQLTPTQLEVLQHLVGGLTVTAAARKVHLHRATIYRWLKDSPAFRDSLDRYQQSVAESAPERLRELRIQAFDALEDSLSGSDSTPAVRLRAAIYILNATQCDTF